MKAVMNANDWDFLKPWLEILAPVLYLPATATRPTNGRQKTVMNAMKLQPRVDYVGINPFLEMVRGMFRNPGGSGPDLTKVGAIGCAMELLALALHVEPRVWTLLRTRTGEPLLLDVDCYDPTTQLGAGLLVQCRGVEMIGAAYAALFLTGGGGPEVQGPTRHDEYESARRRIQAMHPHALRGYQIPVVLEIARTRGDVTVDQIATMIEAMVSTMNVETTIPHRMLQSGWATFRFKDIVVESCETTSAQIARLGRLGAHITRVENSENASDETLRALLCGSPSRAGNAQLLAVEMQLRDDESLLQFHTLLTHSDVVGSLELRVYRPATGLDWTRLAHVLLQTAARRNSVCQSLHSLMIAMKSEPLSDETLDQMDKAITTVVCGPRRCAKLLTTVDATLTKDAVFPVLESSDASHKTVAVVLPDRSTTLVAVSDVELLDGEPPRGVEKLSVPLLNTFCLEATVEDAHVARRLVAMLAKCLPHTSLQALSLDVTCVDDACLELILESFTQLKILRLKSLQLTSVDVLLSAYENEENGPHGCMIHTLELSGGQELSGAVLELLAALADPLKAISKRLLQLQLVFPEEEEAREAFVVAMETMLKTNHSLKYVKITNTQTSQLEMTQRLGGGGDGGMAGRRKMVLALLSMIRAGGGGGGATYASAVVGALDSKIVNQIMAMAERVKFERVVYVEK